MFSASNRVVGGFEALTAMENVESDPKSDKPKVGGREVYLLRDFIRLMNVLSFRNQ